MSQQEGIEMITVRNSTDRGTVNMGWLRAHHSFSFGSYYDPEHMGLGPLRVINEDRIQPAQGFGTHGHQDMEIITYIIEGALEHKDSMSNGSVIRRGDVQRMTAGTGVMHSEFNHLDDAETHLLQIWILPEENGLEPGYEEKSFGNAEKRNRLALVAAGDARDGALKIHQDVDLYASLLDAGKSVAHRFDSGRTGWIQVVSGRIDVNGDVLKSGDGAAIADTSNLTIEADESAEFLLFDMA
jgi:redox-sensitive bicupin YhaK (pirin superfamily)